jgi:ABC-type polysaccharide/polyol phosphate transport system ATPase subunit
MKAISINDVSKTFGRRGSVLLRDQFASWLSRKGSQVPFFALKNISFDVHRGEAVAVIGTNGSGKSTLLSLVCNLTPPDSGSIKVNGRIAALLDIGSGFHPDLTGVENLRLNASLLGLTRQRTKELFDDIVDFSELGEFIKQPLRTYSTGMVMRLAFSVAMHIDPDILIVDEVLGVGDQAFQEKCFERVMTLRKQGHTLLIVSHSGQTLRKVCSRGIWLDHGHLVQDGAINTVMDCYEQRQLAPSH